MVTPELTHEVSTSGAETTGPLTKAFWRRLGEDGYFGLGWPEEYGGGGKSVLYLHAFNYVMMYRRLPVPIVTLNTVAPALMRVGSESAEAGISPPNSSWRDRVRDRL